MRKAGSNLISPPDSTHRNDPYFRVGILDRAMETLDDVSSVGFEAVVELEGDVDVDSLRQAWARLAVLHPILSCARADDRWRPVGAPPFGPDVAPPHHDRPAVALRVSPIDTGTRLTMLCNHIAFDGIASVTLLNDLRDGYNDALAGVDPRPPDWSPRTIEAVGVEEPDIRTLTAAAVRGASAWWQLPVSTHVDPGTTSDVPATDHIVMEFGPVLEKLTPARRRYSWSTDAVLVGVLEKAWTAVFGSPKADASWLVARDLRPALGIERGMGNLSVAAGVSILDPLADLSSVIERVDAAIRAQEGDLVTVASSLKRWRLVSERALGPMLTRADRLRCRRSVSNVGQLGDSLAVWGPAHLRRVWFVGPLADPPFTSFIAAGHGSSTLVSVRTSPDWLTPDHARALERAALELA